MRFETLLVANRGEIAVRILRTAKRLGLRTVAVFSEADRGAPHVHLADRAVLLGPAPAADSYLRADRVIEAALASGAGAVHPGYGFLSENASFARACEAAGVTFVGPTPEQLELFGAKHTARDAASAAGVAMLPGTGLLGSVEEALAGAEQIGYPVMLKATAGGGGIGMQACAGPADLARAFVEVQRLAGASFSATGVFCEQLVTRARHVEVQLFGDGAGGVQLLGDRDCTLQRRNQKVLEESPAPNLPDPVRAAMAADAVRLGRSVGYRSAGTVEYVYDAERGRASFLEVNTRLQVEHPVTEARFGIDLVEWMLRLAQGDRSMLGTDLRPRGAAVEARVYAENADLGHLPSSGTISAARWPAAARVDTWVEPGIEVGTAYDPLLAKIVVHGDDRAQAWAALSTALEATRIDGLATNLGVLKAASRHAAVRAARHTTSTFAEVRDHAPRLEVLKAGTLTTVQDWPGRVGLWPVGVPPSGPMDDLSFRLGNAALGNPEGAPGLEITLDGPALRCHGQALVMVTGAPAPVSVDGRPADQWAPLQLRPGSVLRVDAPTSGMRTYLLVAGGLDVAAVLGSASTFDLGGIGGPAGRPLRTGDVLAIAGPAIGAGAPREVPAADRPSFPDTWEVAALEGPHAAPEFFTVDDLATFYTHPWEVHFNSARTGVRLVGPKPQWARPDGGEAGLHPSNIHDTPYAVGAVDYTGDLPILLGPDGPSLGGFTCPATVASGHRWKLGQLRPGDRVRFVPVGDEQAEVLRTAPTRPARPDRRPVADGGILASVEARPDAPSMTIRRSGDANLLVEYGDMRLDLGARLRVHALAEALAAAGRPGLVELTPGIRSLQVHLDPKLAPAAALVEELCRLDRELPADTDLRVPSRTVRLPLSFDDPATREAIERYLHGVRDDAPWCPWNIEFIRRINGLDSVDDVLRTVFDAEYLVLGLGDVYLGAPVATPVDPRHRLVTTKYNPARTWTPQNAVGIGGAYLCIYGMEGPGGYQFVGRTVQVWSTHRQRGAFEPGVPWLLRQFDRIRWYPVSADELLDLRADQAAGRLELEIHDGTFGLAEHERFLADHADSIAAFRARQATAFEAERLRWVASGEFERAERAAPVAPAEHVVPPGCAAVEAQFAANVFRVDVAAGSRVSAGQPLVAVEAMKMEAQVTAPYDAEVVEVLARPGVQVGAGTPLVILRPAAADAA